MIRKLQTSQNNSGIMNTLYADVSIARHESARFLSHEIGINLLDGLRQKNNKSVKKWRRLLSKPVKTNATSLMRRMCDKDQTSGSISHATIDMQHVRQNTNFRCNDGHAIANATQTTRCKTSDISQFKPTRVRVSNLSTLHILKRMLRTLACVGRTEWITRTLQTISATTPELQMIAT